MKIEYPRKILERIAFTMVLVVVVLGVYFSKTDLSFFEGVWVREDGLTEWMTVLALFVGLIMNLYRASILRPFRNRRFIFGLYCWAFLFFFGFMEEISWGQRIIESFMDFKVPAFFIKYNSQQEMNLHNLQFGGTKINKIIFGTFLGICIGIYFLILPILYKKITSVKNFTDSIALPLPRLYHIGAYLLLAALASMIDGGKKGEILEFGGCWIFLLMSFEPLNREIFSRRSLER